MVGVFKCVVSYLMMKICFLFLYISFCCRLAALPFVYFSISLSLYLAARIAVYNSLPLITITCILKRIINGSVSNKPCNWRWITRTTRKQRLTNANDTKENRFATHFFFIVTFLISIFSDSLLWLSILFFKTFNLLLLSDKTGKERETILIYRFD